VVDLSPAVAAAGEHPRRASWSSIRALLGRNWRPIARLAAAAVLAGLSEAAILAVVAQVAAALVAGGDSVHLGLGPADLNPTIGTLVAVAAVLALARIGLMALISLQQARLASDVQAQMRLDLFAAFTRASWGLQSQDREGHLQEMMTSQSLQAIAATVQLASLVTSLITFLVLVFSAMLLNLAAAVLVVGVALVLVALLRPLSALGRRSAHELSQAQLDAANGIGEAVRMAEETHVFGVEGPQIDRIGGLVDASRDLLFRTAFVNRFVPALFQSLIYLTVLGGLGLVSATGTGNVASLGAVVLLMVRAGTYGQQVQTSYQTILQALPFVDRLREATARYEADGPSFGRRPLASIETVAFAGVGFSYRPGRPVLSEIEFGASRGEALGIVGPSGAGKSTLIQLLLRLRAPGEGRFLVNGVPAGEYAAADWHRAVAYVPQEPQLLHASVADNIRYFRPIGEEAIRRAARLARIDEDVESWRDGYETTIGPRADSISGGQRQRICLARALAAEPEVIVLDEPTSALDPRSERLIHESLEQLAADLTIFVVTHRMTMLSVCDRVLVIVDGRVDDCGETDALRASNAYLSAA
jgi:ATP-binding cassette, subfamily B, bacterial